jgi:S-formylglutathione hydrolase FrmB
MSPLPALLLGTCLALAPGQAPAIDITFTNPVSPRPFTGRVFLIASKQPIKGAPPRLNWFTPYPFFAQDVKDWRPGIPLRFRPTFAYPRPLDQLPAETYHLQAVLDLDRGGPNPLTAPGNGYSDAVVVNLKHPPAGAVALNINHVIPERRFEETERVRLVEIESKLLTAFHGRPMRLRAGVVLPASFGRDAARRYPVVYEIPGFGGDHHMADAAAKRNATDVAGVEMIHVMLDPSCRLGHHVFADSANNGPYGAALVHELIPHIEAKFRGLGVPTARFVTGHSSGGWSSLWLQVAYPDLFGGVWSTAPDPVDFRDFQKVNLYTPKTNLFTDEKGRPRPLARRGGKVALRYKSFSNMETVLGRGGQLASFEAVFSPKGPDGRPRPLWERRTGAIDPDVARAWQPYDIRLRLVADWDRLGPKLAGKLHVYTGADDTFYLDGATRLLKDALARLGSDAAVEIFPGKHHGDLLDAALRQRIAREMAATFRKHHPGS